MTYEQAKGWMSCVVSNYLESQQQEIDRLIAKEIEAFDRTIGMLAKMYEDENRKKA